MVLDELEKEVSKKQGKDVRIADMFDMVAGTSTGSIISLGLTVSDEATNPRPMYRASDLVKLYTEDGKRIFDPISSWDWIKVAAKQPSADKTEQDPAVSILSPYFSAHTKVEMPFEGPFRPPYSSQSFEKLLREKFEDHLKIL